jgi:hypothetical protein
MIEERFGLAVERNTVNGNGHHLGTRGGMADFISSYERYLPVPIMSRELKVVPANVNVSDIKANSHAKPQRTQSPSPFSSAPLSSTLLPAADKMYDLDTVSLVHPNDRPVHPTDDRLIQLYSDPLGRQ